MAQRKIVSKIGTRVRGVLNWSAGEPDDEKYKFYERKRRQLLEKK